MSQCCFKICYKTKNRKQDEDKQMWTAPKWKMKRYDTCFISNCSTLLSWNGNLQYRLIGYRHSLNHCLCNSHGLRLNEKIKKIKCRKTFYLFIRLHAAMVMRLRFHCAVIWWLKSFNYVERWSLNSREW